MTRIRRQVLAEMIKFALDAREKAYVPFSSYKVGASLLTGDGKYSAGKRTHRAC